MTYHDLPSETLDLRLGKIRLLVPRTDPRLYYETLVMNEYGDAMIREGDTVLDVGANIGDYSVWAATVTGPHGRVIALEPNPRWFAILKANIARNRLSNVKAINCAAADQVGYQKFSGDVMVSTGRADSSSSEYTARTSTLDSILESEGLGAVDILKMDIEGAEGAALRGQRFLGQVREAVIEIHGPELLEELTPLFEHLGFTASRFGSRQMVFGTTKSILTHLPSFLEAETRTGWFGSRRMLAAMILGRRVQVSDPTQRELNIMHFSRGRPSSAHLCKGRPN